MGKWELTLVSLRLTARCSPCRHGLSFSSESEFLYSAWLWVSNFSSLLLASLASSPVRSLTAEEVEGCSVEGSGVQAVAESTAVTGSLASCCRTCLQTSLACSGQMDSAGTEEATADVA